MCELGEGRGENKIVNDLRPLASAGNKHIFDSFRLRKLEPNLGNHFPLIIRLLPLNVCLELISRG